MADHGVEAAVEPELPREERSTAPQSEYGLRDVGVGLVVLAVGLVATFGLALAVGL
jgi:hypothetical protein